MKIEQTSRFKRDFKKYKKKHYDMTKVKKVIELIIEEDIQTLITTYNLHRLKGDWKEHYELHIEDDWLLIYLTDKQVCRLERLGTHDELFKG